MKRVTQMTILRYAGLAAAALVLVASARAQGVDLTAQISIQNKAGSTAHKSVPSRADVVVWLTPTQPDPSPASMGHPGPFRLMQKDKMFTPHLLVVPAGSSVEFPNADPFFHNVFSLFNGKRFDLGLYESGTSKSVRFDKEGVSYIFCNIHPEMAAVVVTLNTPYWGVSTASGVVTIHNVLPGSYRMRVWSEAASSINPVETEGIVQVGTAALRLHEIVLKAAADPMAHHKNKFGEDYRPDHNRNY